MTADSHKAPGGRPLVVNAALFTRVHTVLAYAAFSVALLVGCFCHYKKIVKNGVAGYPEEWFPSVSATIGDWYPERNLFQILIALTAGPRFALVIFQYYYHSSVTPSASLPTVVLVFGLIRTISCGGWVYITSSDDHDVHDICMITYMVCNIPWMCGGISCTPSQHTSVRRRRTAIATAFFASIGPLVYFFIQHKVHRIPGAYTHYAFFEWSLIFFDILYDAISEQEFKEAKLQISLAPQSHTSAPIDSQIKPVPNGKETSTPTRTNEMEPSRKTRQSKVTPTPINSSTIRNLSNVLSKSRPSLGILSDIYLAYLFWTLFTALIPTLFYFSVWELGIAGHELALLSTLSPALLGLSSFRQWAASRAGQATLQLLSFVGLAACFLPKPLQRLSVVAPATALAVAQIVAEWMNTETVTESGIVFALGILLVGVSKQLNHGNNPMWPFISVTALKYNGVGLCIAVAAVVERYTRPSPHTVSQKGHKLQHLQAELGRDSILRAALPLGSLLFSLHNMVSDPSTLVAWSWTGYENYSSRGPVPHLHSSLTVVAQSVGLLIALLLTPASSTSTSNRTKDVFGGGYDSLLGHPVWFALGAASSYALYVYRDWAGYLGGMIFALWLMSITTRVIRLTSEGRNSAGTYVAAFFVYCLLNLASIFTAAYAFVPGGWVFRERTDCVLIAQMACLAFAFSWQRLSTTSSRLSLGINSTTSSVSKIVLAAISIISVLVSLYRWPPTPIPFKPGPRVLNAGIWTLHFGIDNTGRDSQRGMTDLIKYTSFPSQRIVNGNSFYTDIRDMELDIVGLLETDLHRTSFGHRDLTRVAVEELGYHVDIGPGPNSHTWGAALLSKFPIINSTHHLLPSPNGELAPAIEAVLDVFGTEVVVVVAHNGQEEDPLDRELQSKELGRIIVSHYPKPTIFLGYVVTKPHAERPAPYKYLVEDGKMHDIDHDDEDRWCEYILYRGLYRTSYARVSRGIITDTELQIGQFTLPKHGVGVTNDTSEARYLRAFKETLPEHHWLPMEYYGSEGEGGVNGHYYHVFGTPLYYDLPEGAVL